MKSSLNGWLCVLVLLTAPSNSFGAAALQEAEVTSVTIFRQGIKLDSQPEKGTPVALNDAVEFKVTTIDALATPPDATGTLPSLLPYLNGFRLKGSSTEYVDRKKGIVRFTLMRNDADADSKKAWAPVLGGLGATVDNVTLSFGPATGGPVSLGSTVGKVYLEKFPEPWTIIAVILILLIFTIFLVLACTTDLLKDPPKDSVRHYSMGRCQMAWWFFIILSSFIGIWLVTGSLTFPNSSLILLGISGATALAAVVIDPNPKKPTDGKQEWSMGKFFQDILSDKDGIAFHRFQIFGWTIILGLIFIAKVINENAQPTFDVTLLTLMGISSGTYIGFKFPEKAAHT